MGLSKQITSPKIMDEESQKWRVRTDTPGKKKYSAHVIATEWGSSFSSRFHCWRQNPKIEVGKDFQEHWVQPVLDPHLVPITGLKIQMPKQQWNAVCTLGNFFKKGQVSNSNKTHVFCSWNLQADRDCKASGKLQWKINYALKKIHYIPEHPQI